MAWRFRDRDRLLKARLSERFMVTTVTGETFDGLLREVDAATVVLINASLVKTDGAALPVDGEIVLRRESVAYMQRPGS